MNDDDSQALHHQWELEQQEKEMDSKSLSEYVRELNKLEQVEIEQRRQQALKRIRELRDQMRRAREKQHQPS